MSAPTPASARAYLAGLEFFGIKLGLENIESLLAAEGDPHRALSCVHVAGTNGKGSVLAFLDAMLRAAGYHTGRFTSPHLLDVTERFLLDAMPVDDVELDAAIEHFRALALAAGRTPTYFELCTAVAFRLFSERGVDAALIETGMGGRLDSTNVVDPLVTAITTIGLDHTEHLGTTLEAIAGEKAGIIKERRPVVVGRMDDGPLAVITAKARALHAPALLLGRHFDGQVSGPGWRPMFVFDSPTLELGPVPLGLPGKHQADNAAVACALALELQGEFRRLSPEAMLQGLASARWPCRLERVCDSPPVIVDAAHNPAGMGHYDALFRKAVVLFACASDKDAGAMLECVAGFAQPLLLTRFPGGRSADPALLPRPGVETRVIPELEEALDEALALASRERPLLITGSIFLAGASRAALQRRGIASPLAF